MRAVIWTKDNCSFCVKAKILLTQKNIPYIENILDINGKDNRSLQPHQKWASKNDLLKLNPQAKTLPQIWLDDMYIGGFTDLLAKLS